MKNISAALVKAQKGFSPALKCQTNPHFKSKYADLAACVEAVVDSLNNAGIMLMQQTTECESGVIVETVFIHESGETLSSGKLHVPAAKQDPQGYGSALTYARRYSLMAACGIAPEDDDGNAGSKKPKSEVAPAEMDQNVIDLYIAGINGAQSLEALKKVYATAYKDAERIGDAKAQARFEQVKDSRKAALQTEITSQA